MMRRILAVAVGLLSFAGLAASQAFTFSQKNSYSVGTAPGVIVTADFNGDGKADLATMDIVGFTVSVLMGNGDGTFRALAAYSLPCQPVHMTVGDFVKDGKPDLLIVCIASSSIYVLPGRGDGTFGQARSTMAPVNVLGFLDYLRPGIGDFNGDGLLDIAFLSFDVAAAASSPISGSLYVMLGRNDGTFGAAQLVPNATGASVSVGDFNKDGKVDLVVSSPANLTLQAVSGKPPTAGPVAILLGNGDGTFRGGATYNLTFGPGPVTVGDVNGDGMPDLVVNGLGGGLAVLTGKGDGTFTPSYGQTVLGNGSVGLPVLAAFRGTKTPDIALPMAFCCQGSVDFLPANGDGTFTSLAQVSTGITSTSVVAGDFDGDGRPDLAAVSFPLELISLQNLMNYVFHTGGPGPQPPGGVKILLNTIATPLGLENAASFSAGALAPESIASVFGAGFSTTKGSATTLPLPMLLNGAAVNVQDALGVMRPAPLFYVSPTQINFEIPAGTAVGNATLSVVTSSTNFSGTLKIVSVAPGVFTLNPGGLAAALLLRVHADATQSVENVYQVDPTTGSVVGLPIDLGPDTEQVYLLIYGTGVRNAKIVTATVGGATVPVLFAGAQGTYVGEDQINVGPLPRSLAGQGKVNVTIVADGAAANTINLTFQ
jgi:uncharacterized protein (TIGR03437 family)